MTFNSLQYAAFLPIVLLMHWRLPHRGRLWLLLGASYFFYGSWDYRFLSLIVISTLVDFNVARVLGATADEARRRRLVAVSLVANLAMLGVFKYYDFFVDSAEQLLNDLGLEANAPALRVVLPVGISFYTFQTLSYTIDVYRRRMVPTTDLLSFAVFVAFFPQLVAGPIERASNLLPQFESPRPLPDRARVRSGCFLILQGLVKKVVIADGIAVYVNSIFTPGVDVGWETVLIGAYGFAIQVYGDFSGYTDIARGSARLLGVDLMENFRQPYLSSSITEFWRRWHISLSTWLRDYLYVGLGGNRGGSFATYRNLFLTMLLAGLWHGAGWTFVVFGALNGVYLAVERFLGVDPPADTTLRPRRLPRIILTFHLFTLSVLVFRATSLDHAFDLLGNLVTLADFGVDTAALASLLLLGLVMLSLDILQVRRQDELAAFELRPAVSGLVMAGMVAGLVIYSGGTPVPFIYFQF